MTQPDNVTAGQAVYTPLTLKVYDTVVLGISNRFLWRCPTSELIALYNRNISANHLDIGVGTGYFLDKAAWPDAAPKITLLDLNENSLKAAADRIARHQPHAITASIFDPIPTDSKFESIGLCYLLHCLPGTMTEKAPNVFDNVAKVSSTGCKVFGATILQGDAPRSKPAQALMDVYNRKGIFSNTDDTFDDLKLALESRFDTVQLTRHGAIALFEATAR
ncbi:MAG: class I SAM-dependent methyltransferase [Pseudomonadota bacterium]